jgi:hypothetical protein
MARHFCNRRRLEQLRDVEFNVRKLVNMDENVGCEEGVSARGEEVIMDADVFELKDLRTTPRQQFLKRRSWCDEALRLGWAPCNT